MEQEGSDHWLQERLIELVPRLERHELKLLLALAVRFIEPRIGQEEQKPASQNEGGWDF